RSVTFLHPLLRASAVHPELPSFPTRRSSDLPLAKGCELRCLRDDRDVRIPDAEIPGFQHLHCRPYEQRAVGALPLRVRIAEVLADVAKPCCAEQRIADSVETDAAVRVRHGAV